MWRPFSLRWPVPGFLALLILTQTAAAQLRDGGIDPANLGKGDWISELSFATDYLGWNIDGITNENSLMLYCKSMGLRYLVVQAGENDQLVTDWYDEIQFTSNLVNVAHANGLLIFGYNRSYGSNIVGEIAIADHVFGQGADGFVWYAQGEWETNRAWIGTNGPAKAWQLCSTVRSNWPNKFLAYAPQAIVSQHASFPYKEFGYWCDTVMPQVYAQDWTNIFSRPSAAINWTDGNWASWQKSVSILGPATIGGQKVYWTNAIKPMAPITQAFGPLEVYEYETPAEFVSEFADYLLVDPHTPNRGYGGASFWRAELQGEVQWSNILAATVGNIPGAVKNLVFDDFGSTTNVGAWTAVRTFYNAANLKTALFAGNGSGTDTNSFGTNYLTRPQGPGTNYALFNFTIVTPGDYQVYQWHPYRAEASSRVPFVINHGRGTTTVYANQKTNAGTWTRLGRFYFAPGTNASIRVTDGIPEPGGIVMVDGLKLAFVNPVSAPAAPIRLKASAQDTDRIMLTWTDAATNSGMFVVGRSKVSGGPYADAGVAPASSTLYTDTGLEPNTTYYYVVRATNYFGASTNTGPVSATTFPETPVVAFGDNSWGQTVPPAACTRVIAVAAGDWHSVALLDSGAVVAWGNDIHNECRVPADLVDAIAIAAGGYHNLAIRRDGSVAAWGDNSSGQSTVPAGLGEVIGIAAGSWHSLALKPDGSVVGWGEDAWGQRTPPPGLTRVIGIAAGGNHSLALRADGTVAAWGENINAAGLYSGQSVPPTGLKNVVAVAAGKYHSLALLADGTVVGWGDNSEGQCTPPAGLTSVVAVAGGGAHSLALKADGNVVAWGAGWNNQCTLPAGLSNYIAVAAGDRHTVCLEAGSIPAPLLLHTGFNGNSFHAVIQTLSRNYYALEFSSSLDPGSWTRLPAVRGNGALRLLADPGVTGSSRFYRFAQW